LPVNEGQRTGGELAVEEGRMVRVGGETPTAGASVIDASGLTLVPDRIDDQVHFREPNMT
jgi:dihydroorotase-like cyclic amidohydrolase